MITLGNIAHDLSDHFANAEHAAATFLDRHLPQIRAVAGSPVVQALEAVALSPAAERLAADLILQLGTPRPELPAGSQIPDGGAESHGEPPGAPSDTPIADEALAALSSGPVIGGTAS